MSYRKAFVPIVLLVVVSLVLATGMNTSAGLAKPDATRVPLPVDETVTPDPPDPGEDWPGPSFEQNSLAGVNYYMHYYYGDDSAVLPDINVLQGARGWNVIIINSAIAECKDGLDLMPALSAQVNGGLVNIVRIDYKQDEKGHSIAVPRSSQGEDYGEWAKAFDQCVDRFRNYHPSDSRNNETYDLANIFIVGNEPNLDGDISPKEYADAYNYLWNYFFQYKEIKLLAAGPSAFYKDEDNTYDSVTWMRDMTYRLAYPDGFAIHTYGIRAGCVDPQQPCDMGWDFDGGFRFYRDLIEDGIVDNFWDKPVYITEFNTWPGDRQNGVQVNTPFDNYISGWIQKAFSDVRNYNDTRGNRPEVRALNWFVDDEQGQWLKLSLRAGYMYRDDPNFARLKLAYDDMQTEFHNPANRGLLRAEIDETAYTTPWGMSPGETQTVLIKVKNTGQTTWQAYEHGLAATSNNQMIVSNAINCGSTQNGVVTVFALCRDVAPGDSYDFWFDITMPINIPTSAKLEFQMSISTPVEGDPRTYLFWFGELQSWRIETINGHVLINHSIAAGGSHTCAIVDGGVKCWGGNWYSQLGNGINYSPVPIDVNGLGPGSGVVSLAAGGGHTCALLSGGTVKCWGDNRQGQLGIDNPQVLESDLPMDVIDLYNVVKISAGNAHTCALLNNGTLKCWGDNEFGQIGDGTADNERFSPVPVSNLGTVVDVGTGLGHTCAITTLDGVKCWGWNYDGQLGTVTTSVCGPTPCSPTPVNVDGLGPESGVAHITLGNAHSCAWSYSGFEGEGTSGVPVPVLDTWVKCWGANQFGQSGNLSYPSSSTPLDVVGLSGHEITNIVLTVSTFDNHTCALGIHGWLKCWGKNWFGQVGTGQNAGQYNTPVDVYNLGPGSSVTDISAGADHTCAKISTNWLKCWGNNENGQLGDGTTVDRNVPVDVVNIP